MKKLFFLLLISMSISFNSRAITPRQNSHRIRRQARNELLVIFKNYAVQQFKNIKNLPQVLAALCSPSPG